MTRNIRKLSHPKVEAEKQLLARSRVCQRCQNVHAASNVAMLCEIPQVKDVKRHKNMHNILNTFISHVEGIKGSVHNIHTFNGMHVGGVIGSFEFILWILIQSI